MALFHTCLYVCTFLSMLQSTFYARAVFQDFWDFRRRTFSQQSPLLSLWLTWILESHYLFPLGRLSCCLLRRGGMMMRRRRRGQKRGSGKEKREPRQDEDKDKIWSKGLGENGRWWGGTGGWFYRRNPRWTSPSQWRISVTANSPMVMNLASPPPFPTTATWGNVRPEACLAGKHQGSVFLETQMFQEGIGPSIANEQRWKSNLLGRMTRKSPFDE